MQVNFEVGPGRTLKIRINPRSWLRWCKEGTQMESLKAECAAKTIRAKLTVNLNEVILPKAKAMPHADFNKLMRLGILGKKHEVKCITNPKGIFGNVNINGMSKGKKKFNPENYNKRRHEYIP